MTRCVFPLRTSVEWFDHPASPAIDGRAKQAAVLYDEVVFEDGLFEIDITDGGAVQIWHPPESATEERLARANHPLEIGTPVIFSVGAQPAQGIPAAPEDMRVMMAGALKQRYVAELVSSVLAHVAEFNDGWAQIAFTGHMNASDFDRWLPHRSTRAVWDKALMPELGESNQWLRDFVIKSFDRDAALAAALDADFHVSPLFEPMVRARGPEGLSGTAAHDALSYLFPDVTDLPWEVVMEFRAHDASREARSKLHGAIARTRQDGMLAADNALTRDMLFAEKELRKRHSLSERLTRIAVSVIPMAGGPLAEGSAAMAEAARRKRDWVAALSLLRK